MANQNRTRKISTGPNARPRDETIAQTGGGIPDDTGARNPDLAEEATRGEEAAKQLFKRRGEARGTPDEGKFAHQQPVEGGRGLIERELDRSSGKQRKR